MVRDDKAKDVGVFSNGEEIDIFSNADYFQAEQIMTSDTMPSGSNIYAYTADNSDIVYGLGEDSSNNRVRIVSVASGGGDNPGSFATLHTSTDSTNLVYPQSPVQYFKTTESNKNWLYFYVKASTTIKLARFNIGTPADPSIVGTLTGLDGTHDRLSLKSIFGTLYVMNGNYIASVDKDGVFTNAAFTLPNDWEAVDITEAGDQAVILARHVDRTLNLCKGFWWDLTSTSGPSDSFDIPMGGPQWITKHREKIIICCAINGIMNLFELSGAFQGAVPSKINNIGLTNMQVDGANQEVSPPRSVSQKDNILYFALYKTDKSGIYALGKIDDNKRWALVLAKRYHTSNYATHTPYSLFIHGPNYYGAFNDNGTVSNARCESNNSPARSSNAVYETIVIDEDTALTNKTVEQIFVVTHPLPASTSVACYTSKDYGSYNQIYLADGGSHSTTGAVVGTFPKTKLTNAKSFKIKLVLTSSGTSSPKVTMLAWNSINEKIPVAK